MLAFVDDHEGQLLHEAAQRGPLHGEILGDGTSCGQNQLALAQHLSSFSRVDVEFVWE